MTKSERDELRRIIRQRMKVLRADVSARQAELVAELDQRLTAWYAADLKAYNDVAYLVGEAVREANRKVNDLWRAYYGPDKWGVDADRPIVGAQPVAGPSQDRSTDRRTGIAQIEAQVRAALVELERREVALMEELAVGALESAEARDFLGRIPTVAELVPASRIAALTAAITDEDDRR
jgi:hypothetical protein